MNIPWKLFATIIIGMTMLNAQVKNEETKIRILLTTGGHEFEKKPFFEMNFQWLTKI